jgi:hypothetical protein
LDFLVVDTNHTKDSVMSRYLWIQKVENFLWVLFLITLPVTSFPIFPSGLGGSTLVRPLSIYPLLVLLIIAVLPRLVNRSITRTLLPLLAFILVAIVGTLLALLREIDPVVGVTVPERAIRTLFTLFIGFGYFTVVTLIPNTPEKLRSSLRWLYIGFVLALLWGSLQAVYVLNFQRSYFDLLSRIQQLISIRKLFPTRISGMTYEPNWFAEQLAFLLMPWLFVAVFSRNSVFRWRGRWDWLSIEFLLLVWTTGILLFTFSRTGMILLAIQLIFVFLFRPLSQQIPSEIDGKNRWLLVRNRIFQAVLALLFFVFVVFVVGSRNNYFSRLWNYWIDEDSTGQYLQYISFDQRFEYWGTAFRIFEAHPAFGVGLGNFTFYFNDFLTDRPLHPTPELLIKLTPESGRSQISTVKGLFPRLLAETGILGLATFLGFITALLGCAVFLVMSSDKTIQYWGRAGLLGLAVFLVVSFSFDSFSLPNMWVLFGFITAAAKVFTDKKYENLCSL